jgi:hypothetical protein
VSLGVRLAAVVLVALPGLVEAQIPRPIPPRTQPGVSQRTPARDTTPPDTTIQWSPADSVMQALLAKPDYSVTRYEGGVVTFDAVTKALAIAAATAQRAIVQRDSMRAVTDTQIVYDDRTNSVSVSGRFSIVLGEGQAPVQGSGTARYNLARRSGRLTNARTTVDESGERWFIQSEISIPVLGDSARGIYPRFYGLDGTLTSCDDSIPDYYFRMKEIKRTRNTIVARPAVLYLRDIPVMWLPFVFQDIRPGRRSGILSPQIGTTDIVRSNPTYRRMVENIGYYWAATDYFDVAMWGDWRSSAGADSTDPGWYKLNWESKYNWLSRFLDGRLATSFTKERSGSQNLAVSWSHRQRFTTNRNFNANVNYTTSTTLQRRNTFLPAAAIATILSQVTLTDKIGPASLSFGATQRQFPGRSQLERSPTMSLSSRPIAIGEWFVWTPGVNFSETQTLNMDSPGTLTQRFIPDANGQLVRADSLKRNMFNRTVSFSSPLRIFGMDFSQNVAISDLLKDFPGEEQFYQDADSSKKEVRIFRRTFKTTVDWNPSLSLPPIFRNRFKLTPSISLSNVDPGPYWVRTHISGGEFVQQSKRLTYGISSSPTLYGLWPGFGPFQRIRHAVSPTLSYSYAPSATVSDAYLEAIGSNRDVYRGSLQQSAISFGLSQNVEAKVRPTQDSGSTESGQKLKLLTMSFTPLSYDFERASKAGRKLAGLTTESFGAGVRSDLLPGFDVQVNYSLFQGSTLTDTAQFKPFLTSVSSRLQLSNEENPLTVITRLFGRAVPERSTPITTGQQPQDAALAREIANQPVAGQAARGQQFIVPPTQGWRASLSFTTSRPRPVSGDRVDEVDPRVICEPLKNLNPFLYDECFRQPMAEDSIPSTTFGARTLRMPRQTSLTGDMSFALTRKWSASWNTSYDFEQSQFASHVVSLQRDLHDWRAIFSFTHSPNGNFAFHFFIALKPQPDLKFDYSRATVRSR